MAYQNDMATLADVVGPAYAAQQAGIQNDAANQEQQIKNEVAEGTKAADIAKPGLQNMFTQAQTGVEQGLAKQQNAAGDVASALTPSNIQLGQTKNQTAISADKIQQFGQMAMFAGQVASFMGNVPEAARPAAMSQLAQRYGIDPNDLGPLASGDPETLGKFRDSLLKGTADWQKAQLEATTKQGVATTEATARTTAADASANARKYAADAQERIKQLNQNVDQAIVSLGRKVAAAGTNADPNDRALLQVLQQQQIISRQLGAQNTAQLVGQGNIAQAPVFNPTGPGQGTQPGTPPAGNAVEAEMRRRGLLK